MIFDRIMLPAQGRNEDYKFAQTGSVTLVASAGGSGGSSTPAPSWLENVIKIDPESGYPSVQDWHVKGNLVLEGQVNQWLAQQLVVEDARIQVTWKQGGAVADSGLVIYDKDTSAEVSSLVYDVNGIWRAGGDRLFTEAYNPKLGGYAAADYPRKDEAAVITGGWKFFSDNFDSHIKIQRGGLFGSMTLLSAGGVLISGNDAPAGGNSAVFKPSGFVGLGVIDPSERLHVAGNGLFTGNLTAPTFVSGFAGSGWRLEAGAENHLTVDRLSVRGRMDVYELVVNQIRGTNGALWVSDSAKVASVSGNRLTIDTGGSTSFVPFVENDLLRCQRWNGKNIKYYVVRVTAVGSNYIDVALVNGSSPREAGDHLVRMGNTEDTDRQGALYLTSSDSNAPYMDVLDGVNSASFAGKTKVRIGKLDGITDPDLGTLSGYGLYTENGYFKGKITVTGGNAATKEDVDAVQVGGRNLIRNSSFEGPAFYTLSSVNGGVNTISDEYAYDGSKAWKCVTTGSTNTSGGYIQISGLEIGGTYTFSGRVMSLDVAPVELRILTTSWGTVKGQKATLEAGVWQRVAVTFEATGSTLRLAVVNGAYEYPTYYIDAIKLELGNRATDWTPAPEDVDAGIASITTRVEDTLGLAALESINETLITGGKVRTSLLEVTDIVAAGITAGHVEGLTLHFTKGTFEGSLITGMIESQNWDGENGSRLNLLDGSLEFGNTIKVDSFSKEIIVKDGNTQNTGVRIGDFLLSSTTGGAGALDVDLSGSSTVPTYAQPYPPDPLFSLHDALTYINGSGVIKRSSVTVPSETVSTNLTAGNNYTFQTNINVRITRGNVMDTATDPVGAPLTVINSFSKGGVKPVITVSLFSGATKVGEQTIQIGNRPDLGVATFSDMSLSINIPFIAASNSLRVEITQSGEVEWKVRYPASQGNLVEFRNAGLIYSELNTSSRVRIVPSAAINELSAKGFLSLWGPEKYFRIYDRVGVTNFIEARGAQMYISPNGNVRLRIDDTGIWKLESSTGSWIKL